MDETQKCYPAAVIRQQQEAHTQQETLRLHDSPSGTSNEDADRTRQWDTSETGEHNQMKNLMDDVVTLKEITAPKPTLNRKCRRCIKFKQRNKMPCKDRCNVI